MFLKRNNKYKQSKRKRNNKMNDTFIELTSYLITELQKFIEYNNTYDYKKQIKHYQENSNDSNEMKLQKQETWFDQISEKYLKIEELFILERK